MRRAAPNTPDLLLMRVEAGMSIEHAFRRVGGEISGQSRALAEELAITTAELSYLPERNQACMKLRICTGLEPLRQVTAGLIQAEKCGAPPGKTLRIAARELRHAGMHEAEKRAQRCRRSLHCR